MDTEKLYENSGVFRGYVDRYANQMGINVKEALRHAMVKSYAGCLAEQPQNDLL